MLQALYAGACQPAMGNCVINLWDAATQNLAQVAQLSNLDFVLAGHSYRPIVSVKPLLPPE